MNKKNNYYLSLALWIVMLVVIGSVIGSVTKSGVDSWYSILNRSSLTPPNYVFPIAWTILYVLIAISGWIVWKSISFSQLKLIKSLYIMQLILNWMWTPLFFHYHLAGFSLVNLVVMDVLVSLIIYLAYKKARLVSLLMIPYLLWILFASYLNFYIWKYN